MKKTRFIVPAIALLSVVSATSVAASTANPIIKAGEAIEIGQIPSSEMPNFELLDQGNSARAIAIGDTPSDVFVDKPTQLEVLAVGRLPELRDSNREMEDIKVAPIGRLNPEDVSALGLGVDWWNAVIGNGDILPMP